MGLADVRVLAETWEDAKRKGGDLGAETSSLNYPRRRYPENALMLTAVDTFHHVFRNRAGLLNWGRGMVFDMINEIGPLKKAFMGGAGAASLGQPGAKTGQTGWGSTAASGLEGWLGFKSVVGTAAGFAGELAKNGLRKVADNLEKR
jgi:ubiquinone biosynthesis monooxygenase Coq6